ncbi:MAG: alkaline phosphatase [Bacteroidota bacterium]
MLPTVLLALACSPKTPPEPLAREVRAPKNVILVIGDGMGPQQVGLLELYKQLRPSRPPGEPPSAFATIAAAGGMGMSMSYPYGYLVTDSACSATQLASGVPSLVRAVGVDADGASVPTVLEVAKARGLATGLVSDTRLTHATPASFAAHVPSRDMENVIAEQMLAVGPDVMLSGGLRHFAPASAEGSRRDDDRDLLAEAEAAGYTVVTDRDGLAGAGPKVLGLFAASGMLDAITERRTREAADRTEPTLTDMAMAAIDRLDDDDDGFFLMIESGQIDWAGHANDAGWLLHEMLRADEMLTEVQRWVAQDGETLLVVTADHETGGLGVGYRRGDAPEPRELPGEVFAGVLFDPGQSFGEPVQLDRLAEQKAPFHVLLQQMKQTGPVTPSRLVDAIEAGTGFTIDEAAARRILASHPDPLGEAQGDIPAVRDFAAFFAASEYARTALVARELSRAHNIVWGTGGHTHTPVPIYAMGPGASTYTTFLHHTDIGAGLMAWARGTE